MVLSPDELSRLDLKVHYLGGPDDPWLAEGRGDFPSTTTARANRYFAKHGRPMPIYSRGHLVIDFIEEDLVLGSGSYLGRPFKLMHWQKRMIAEMYEVTEQEVYDIEADAEITKWMRRNRWAYIQLPKKNGKTEIAAGLGLYHLVAEEDSISPNIVCAAASDEQADLVFGAATQMSRRGQIESVTNTKHKTIESTHNSGLFHRLAAASGTNDGKNISTTLIDELHEWVKPNARAIYDVITQGGAARPEFYNIMITTPGSEQDSIAYEFYEQVKDSIDGVKDDDTLYGLVFEVPADADFKDPATWERANPGYGKIVHRAFYEDMVTKRREAVFRRYFCGQWTETEDIWEAAALWDGLEDQSYEFDEAEPVYVGIDIGLKHDTTAVVLAQWDYENDRVITDFRIWQNPYSKRTAAHAEWRLEIAEVENYLREIRERFPKSAMEDPEDDYPMPGPAFFYDPHLFSRSAQSLAPDGLNMVEVPQTDTIMAPASQRIFTLIKESRVGHKGDPAVRKHVRSVVPLERERTWRISKTKSNKAIDAMIALAMAAFYCSNIHGIDEGDDDPAIY